MVYKRTDICNDGKTKIKKLRELEGPRAIRLQPFIWYDICHFKEKKGFINVFRFKAACVRKGGSRGPSDILKPCYQLSHDMGSRVVTHFLRLPALEITGEKIDENN